jgi:hypothetical protein
MSVVVASVDAEAKALIRSRLPDETLAYIAKAKLLVALPLPSKWTELSVGYLALTTVPENSRSFLSLYDCDDYALIMSHELYYRFDQHYTKLSPTLYAFPSDLGMLGFQFLLESEAHTMEKIVKQATPRRRGGLRDLFKKKSGSKEDACLVSMPHDSEHEVGMRWDIEQGYVVVGSLSDLPEEHRQFIQAQRRSDIE